MPGPRWSPPPTAAPALAAAGRFPRRARARHHPLSPRGSARCDDAAARVRRRDDRHRRRRSLRRRARAPTLIRAVRARLPQARFVGVAGPRMEAAGCEAWYPLETLAVRGFVEVLSRLPAARRAPPRALPAPASPSACRCSSASTRRTSTSASSAKLKRAGVRTPAFRQPVGLGVAPRARAARSAARSHRMLALFPFEPPLYEAAGIPVTFVGHPLAAEAAALRLAARGARAAEARRSRSRCSRCCPAAARPSSTCTATSCCGRRRRSMRRGRTRAFSCRSPRGRRATGSRRRIYRLGLEKLPLTLLYGHATDALRAADVALVASGTATLEAALARCPHVIFYRVHAADRAHRPAQAAAAVGRAAEHPRGKVRRAGAPAGRRDGRESRAGGAQPLRRHGDAAAPRSAVRGLRRVARGRHGRPRRGAVAAELRAAGVAC